MEIKWNCPHCGFENTDNPDETVLPLCAGCDMQVYWDEIGDNTQPSAEQENKK